MRPTVPRHSDLVPAVVGPRRAGDGSRAVVGLAAAAVLVLGGCGSDPEDVEIGDGVIPTSEAQDGSERDADPTATPVPGGGASPAPGSCVDLPEAEDGLYIVADAGTVSVALEEGTLTVGSVQPAGGWEHEVESESGDEVEVEFRSDDGELDFEAEIEDGAIAAKICADDD